MFGHEILYWLLREEMIERCIMVFLYSDIYNGFLLIARMTVVECLYCRKMKIVDWMALGSSDIRGHND